MTLLDNLEKNIGSNSLFTKDFSLIYNFCKSIAIFLDKEGDIDYSKSILEYIKMNNNNNQLTFVNRIHLNEFELFDKLIEAYDKQMKQRIVFLLQDTFCSGSTKKIEANSTYNLFSFSNMEINSDLKWKLNFKPTIYFSFLLPHNQFLLINSTWNSYTHVVMNNIMIIPDLPEMDYENNPWYGKYICVTGATTIKRDNLEYLIKIFGGTFQKAVNKKTDFLISVEEDIKRYNVLTSFDKTKTYQELIQHNEYYYFSSKMKKLFELQNEKKEALNAKLLTCEEFVSLLNINNSESIKLT